MTAVTALAPAKVNLYLHVTGRRTDGYHLVEGLVAFADIGDHLTIAPAPDLSLEVAGPEATGLAGAAADNLVLRAARLLADHARITAGAALRLEKNLPVAAGIGGGSSDAAAALHALRRMWRVAIDDKTLFELGARIGADVPACLYGRPAWVRGVGERLDPAGELPPAGILLANPRKPLATAAVFARRRGPFSDDDDRSKPMPRDAAGLAELLVLRRNDLTEAAIELVPEIGDVLARLRALPGVLLARMSGSGATCFALFHDRAAAEQARRTVAAAEPEWWCAAAGFVAAATHTR